MIYKTIWVLKTCMSDLTTTAIRGVYYTKTPTNEQIKRSKRYGKELII